MSISVPDGWTEVDTEFGQQERAFQRRRDGLVVSIERGTTSDQYAVSFLPQNFAEDNQAIRSYGDNGYLYSGDSLNEALEEAAEWMEENPRD
jgi:hypothetical protein